MTHIKTIGGRKYKYEMRDVEVPGKKYLQRREVYAGPVEPRQPAIMEMLKDYDTTKITEAWKDGVGVGAIAVYIKAATGHRPADQTVYAYFRKRGVKREKRKQRKKKA